MHIHGIFAALAIGISLAAPVAASPPDETLPPGQVYECTTNGQHVFSDKRCGPNASIRQLNALNTMEPAASKPAPVLRAPPPYYPEDAGYSADTGASEQAEDYSSAAEPSVVYYGGVRRGAYVPRTHPPHHHVRAHPAPAPHAALPR